MRLPLACVRVLVLTFFTLASLACDGATGESCGHEYTRSCVCGNGVSGVQTCDPDVGWGDCACKYMSPGADDPVGAMPTQGATGGHAGSSSSGGGSGTNMGGGVDTPPTSQPDAGTSSSASGPVELARGSSTLLDVFLQEDDAWVIDADGVRRMSVTSGALLSHWEAQSPLTAVVFDGTRLVVADEARLSVLDAPTLVVQRDGALIAACASMVLLSGDHLVCGSRNEVDRVFYTYDVATCELVTQSDPYSHVGTGMRRIPGHDAFFAFDDAHGGLFQLGTDARAVLVSDIGDRLGGGSFTFDADQPKHVVDPGGALLALDGCTNTTPALCLAVDGSLGTLGAGQRFIALDHVDSTVVGLVSSDADSTSVLCRDKACRLQRIDVPMRTIRTQRSVRLPLARVIALRAQASQKSVVIGYEPTPAATDASTAEYVVARLPLHSSN